MQDQIVQDQIVQDQIVQDQRLSRIRDCAGSDFPGSDFPGSDCAGSDCAGSDCDCCGLGQCLLHFISRGKSKNDGMKLKDTGYEFPLTLTLYMISSRTAGSILKHIYGHILLRQTYNIFSSLWYSLW